MKIVLFVSFLILALLVTFFLWYYFFGETGELKKAKKEFEIFGLSRWFVPQGIAFDKEHNKFLICGYVSKKYQASRIYIVDKETYKLDKFVKIKNQSGTNFEGHSGGICVYDGNVWIASDGRLFRLKIEDLQSAKNSEYVCIVDSFQTKNNADFCFVYDGYVWVGEFYKLGKFRTDISHHFTLEDGSISHAIALAFKIDKTGNCGVLDFYAKKALTLPDIAQGVAVSNDRIFVSTSYGLKNSVIFEYENVFTKKTNKFFVEDGLICDLWELGEKNLKDTHILPEMSEEIEFVDGKLFILFESAAKKYRIFTRTGLNHVFSIK